MAFFATKKSLEIAKAEVARYKPFRAKWEESETQRVHLADDNERLAKEVKDLKAELSTAKGSNVSRTVDLNKANEKNATLTTALKAAEKRAETAESKLEQHLNAEKAAKVNPKASKSTETALIKATAQLAAVNKAMSQYKETNPAIRAIRTAMAAVK